MEKKFVSAFKINGVPILPPLINDEVRAMINESRQKAIEIERRILQRRKEAAATAAAAVAGNDQQPVKVEVAESSLSSEETLTNQGGDEDPLKKRRNSNEALPRDMVINCTNNDNVDHDQSEQTPSAPNDEVPTVNPDPETPSAPGDEVPTVNPEPEAKVNAEESYGEDHVDPEIDRLDSSETITEEKNEPSDPDLVRLSLTRTVTPTSDEMLPCVPLVRCNTFDLQKPSVDLKMLQSMQHSTPVDRSKSLGGLYPVKMPQEEEIKKADHNVRLSIFSAEAKSVTKPCEPAPPTGAAATPSEPMCTLKPKAVESVPLKKVSKGKSKCGSRRSSNCSISSTSTVNLSVESISNALSEHEKRMKELLKRQEEERMLLERKFREQTEELVALCAKSTINGKSPVLTESNGAAVPKTSSTVSMLSLCDISYDSCPDTDTDAAYLTCNNNGTSDELLSGIEEPTLPAAIDTNGNGGNHGNPLEEMPQRVQCAATIINAYARGYLTRRLFQTSEVQSMKQTIVDILTFIVSSRNGQGDDLDASLRRNAFKHIAFCLDRLHDVFVNYTPQQRMQMIRRDRYLKKKEATRPRTN